MLAGSLVGAPQHSAPANRRLQDFQQKPFSELDHGTVDSFRDRGQGRAACGVRSAQLQQTLDKSYDVEKEMRNAGRLKLGYYQVSDLVLQGVICAVKPKPAIGATVNSQRTANGIAKLASSYGVVLRKHLDAVC